MSFRLKIVVGLLVIQLILLALLAWSSLNFLRTSNEVELSNRAATTASLLAATTTTAVLTADLAALQSFANAILGQPGTAYVRIKDSEGVLVEAGDKEVLARTFVEDFLVEDARDGIFDVTAEIRDEGVAFGSVELGFSTAAISNVMNAARRETGTIAVIGLGVSVVFSLMLGNYFARQLKTLRDATRRIAAGDIGHQLGVSGTDELAQTANAFNTMSRRLAILYSEKQAALNGARQTARDLSESERRIHAVLNNVVDGIITADESGVVESINPAAERTFGYAPDEVVGKSVLQLIAGGRRPGDENFLRDYMEAARSRNGLRQREIAGRRKDGSTFPMELDVSDVRIEGRGLFILITRDVTERKQAEMDLRQAKDAALESARSKFEFIANVSHEIRTPMNGVLSTINLLLDTELNEEQRYYVERINSSGDALITIINDVLDFSKIESGKLYLEAIHFDLRRTLGLVCQSLMQAAAAKGLNLAYVIPYTVPEALRGDPTRLRQVLINLVDNAIKFTEAGRVTVRVSVVEDAGDAAVLRFEVEDTGVGIAAATRQRIFKIFAETDARLTRHYGGTGLGLLISKNLVEMMSGAIGVDSEVGKGSTFWFTARIEKPSGAPPPAPTSYEELKGLRALVVDPDGSGRAYMENMLHTVGMHIHGVADGAHALEELCTAAAKGHPYDLVIFDMLMPGMSGLQLARAIKGDSRIASVRMFMVATTGYRGDSEEVRRAGILGYLTAPIRQSQLFDCLSAAVRAAESDREAFVTKHSVAPQAGRHYGHILAVVSDVQEQLPLFGMLEALGYWVSWAGSGADALRAVAQTGYDLVLIAERLADGAGADVIGRIRVRENAEHHVPIIALVAEESAAEARDRHLAAGADDCLVEPVDARTLREKLKY